MPKKTLSVTLTAEQVDGLQKALGNGSTPLSDDQIQITVGIAFSAWFGALASGRKHRSLTELYLEWLEQVYSEVLTDEEPGQRRIYSQFQFSYGQAQYLARVLLQHQVSTWRRKALIALRDSLSDRLSEAKVWIKNSRGEERMSFVLSKASRVELENILASLLDRGSKNLSPTKPEGTMGGYTNLSIVASNIEVILTEVKAQLGGEK